MSDKCYRGRGVTGAHRGRIAEMRVRFPSSPIFSKSKYWIDTDFELGDAMSSYCEKLTVYIGGCRFKW